MFVGGARELKALRGPLSGSVTQTQRESVGAGRAAGLIKDGLQKLIAGKDNNHGNFGGESFDDL